MNNTQKQQAAEPAEPGIEDMYSEAQIVAWAERHDLFGCMSLMDLRCAFEDAASTEPESAAGDRAPNGRSFMQAPAAPAEKAKPDANDFGAFLDVLQRFGILPTPAALAAVLAQHVEFVRLCETLAKSAAPTSAPVSILTGIAAHGSQIQQAPTGTPILFDRGPH